MHYFRDAKEIVIARSIVAGTIHHRSRRLRFYSPAELIDTYDWQEGVWVLKFDGSINAYAFEYRPAEWNFTEQLPIV